MNSIPEFFGSMVFNDEAMKKFLSEEVYKALKSTIENGQHLDNSMANEVANGMKEWALSLGCTHFTHWFQPMTGITAEKHDSFIVPADSGKVIMEFSGKELIKGESDASSFPSGGIRATFEARGYTAWDPTSYAFVMGNTLYIPTIFLSYTGEVLDKKTPLLRSMERISAEAVRLLKALGRDDVTHVNASVGAEQEYFLIDKEMYLERRDLMYTGRTLFGARPPKGQEMDDHYFGAIKPRVAAFMEDLDRELWKLGVLAKTEHNEAAPCQHEIAPIFTSCNLASDQNQLTMRVMKNLAPKHGFVCLLHEKPFEGVNGSGKHNNWSLSTNTGENLFRPGKKPFENKQFLLFLSAVIKGVDEFQDLLRISVATAGNDHRLGAHEAPPAIMSIFLGSELEEILEAVANGEEYIGVKRAKMGLGVDALPEFKKDTTDRNRTSPFAFTGNKFEFRSLGSSLNIACPNIIINTIVAEQLSQFADILEKSDNVEKDVEKIIGDVYRNHHRIIFNGNNYAEEWLEEAKSRGLCNYRTMPEAMEHYGDEKNIKLFEKNKVYTASEIHARTEILLESYSKTINIEALTMLDMARKDIFPAVSRFVGEVSNTAVSMKKLEAGINPKAEIELIAKLSDLLIKFSQYCNELEEAVNKAHNHKGDALSLAYIYCNEVLGTMNKLRKVSDEMEQYTDAQYWPYPSYGRLMFTV
ncbi:MAG: glutamine synthetase III [Eubacteriales bacterium]|nr:glutamine synthetase III [Eubacteriales bacterium]